MIEWGVVVFCKLALCEAFWNLAILHTLSRTFFSSQGQEANSQHRVPRALFTAFFPYFYISVGHIMYQRSIHQSLVLQNLGC